MSSAIRVFAACLLLLASVLIASTPASAAGPAGKLSGRVTSSTTGLPLEGVCVNLGIPGQFCFGDTTKADGSYSIDLDALSASDGGKWRLYFIKAGYITNNSPQFTSNHGYVYNHVMAPNPLPAGPCDVNRVGTPTTTVYLPNITRTFGGPSGWYTPFIIQNTSASANTDLEISFYKFSDGVCVSRINVPALKPGTAYDNNPNDNGKNPTLPGDAQYSVVVKSFGASIVGVVNQVQGSGARAEAMSYDGFSAGATTVSLPNIVRRFGGYVSPFIIQNLGTASTVATATFRPFDGIGGNVILSRTIDPGRAKDVNPNSDEPGIGAPGLVNGKQYGVTITSVQPIAAVVNTVNDEPSVANPVALATNGVAAGAATIYGAYAAKNAQGVGRYSPIIVQNLGTVAVTPTITFKPLAGGPGTANTFTFPSIAPNSSKAFDPRFSFDTQQGTGTPAPCGAHSATCLGDGEYAFSIAAVTGSSIAAQINAVSATTAMGYAATPAPAIKYFLPNLTKSLCFCPSPQRGTGWTTPIILQSVTATSVTLKWYRFSTDPTLNGVLLATQTVALTPGSGTRIDPWDVGGLPADAQFSVVADAGASGTITAIVTEFESSGDNAMVYEGFPAP